MSTKVDQARALIRQTVVPPELRTLGEQDVGRYAIDEARLLYYNGQATAFLTKEVSADVLAQSLAYWIDLDLTSVADEHAVPLGASKHRGLPHLPPGFAWPKGQYFLAQLNLAELHPHDLEAAFPASGMLYLFFDPSGARCTVHHHAGPVDALTITAYPDPKTLANSKYYLEVFQDAGSLIRFVPGYVLYVGGDSSDYRSTAKLLPPALAAELDAVLGCPMRPRDSSTRLFGRPQFWQGEDELFVDDQVLDYSEYGGPAGPGEPKRLLFQDEFGEGHIHVWVATDAGARHDYAACDVTYSGT